MIKQDIWKLFWNTFKIGDDVILITDEDKFACGELIYADDEGLRIKVRWRTEYYFHWAVVKFMAKDGFPVKKLMGADGSSSIEKFDSEVTIGSISELTKEIKEKEYQIASWKELSKEAIRNVLIKDLAEPTHVFVSGDPYLIEDVFAKIVNVGNEWILNEYWAEDNLYEETICLKHKNGAVGFLWDLSTIYYFE